MRKYCACAIIVYAFFMNTLRDALDEARALLARVDTDEPGRVDVDLLGRAAQLLEAALNEAMAAAVLSGDSVRSVAQAAGIAPNSVPPRLARSRSLAPYAEGGRLSGDAIGAARYEASRTLKFTPKKPDSLS